MENNNKLIMKFCKKCKTETERYSTGKCKICTRKAHNEWAKNNPEGTKASKDAYRQANKEKIKTQNKIYRMNNIEKIKNKSREFYAKNRNIILEKTKSYYHNNKSKAIACRVSWRRRNRKKVAEASALWRSLNPEKVKNAQKDYENSHKSEIKARSHNRRLNNSKLSPGIFKKLLKLQRGKCACCGLPLGNNPHLDHIFPLARGGDNSDGNIQLLRARCNLQKSTKHPIDFMQERGFLL